MFFHKKQSGVTWLIVFLGNPGPKYQGTRHNAGFMTADVVARQAGVRIDRLKFQALTATAVLGDTSVLLLKPQTYMNLSGNAVQQAAAFYRIPLDHILVISDDVSLPVGKLRIRREGSAGGHNGLKDIIAKCGGSQFPRIKIGVGAPPHPDYDMADWVLGTFQNQDAVLMEQATKQAAEAITILLRDGIDQAMQRFN